MLDLLSWVFCKCVYMMPSRHSSQLWLSSKECLLMQETWETQVESLGQKDPLEEEMATDSSILAWEISWTEEPAGGVTKSRTQLSTHTHTHTHRSWVAWME